jgi:hypothetical protein
LYNEGVDLIHQIKHTNLTPEEMKAKKHRLNYILAMSPKVHAKLKESK